MSGRPRHSAGAGRRTTGEEPRRLRDVGKRRWRDGSMVAERDTEQMHAVMRATVVPRNRLRPGTVVLARVPFEPARDADGTSAAEQEKVRPVVVVAVTGHECICRPCTSSAARHRHPWAHTEIADVTSAGLSRPTGVKRREVVVALTDCIGVWGVLAESDLENVLGRVFADA